MRGADKPVRGAAHLTLPSLGDRPLPLPLKGGEGPWSAVDPPGQLCAIRRYQIAVDAIDGRTLEQRLRLIEDQLEIYNLIASHPPSADTGAGDYTASVWTEGGVFDRGPEFPRPTGREAIAGGSSNPEHHRAIEQGIAHFAGLPYVRVAGDTAYAISYLQILVPDRVGPLVDVPNHGSSRGFHVHRVSANRWELSAPTRAGKIKRRTLRPLDGTEPARQILGGALEP